MTSGSRRRLLRTGLALAGWGLAGGCSAWPLVGRRPSRVPRIGYFGLSGGTRNFEQFQIGLRDLGHVEGQTIVVELRWAETSEQLPSLAAELVARPVDVLVAAGTTPVKAAMGVTQTIPIVFPNIGDPVRSGLVASLARPGGNVTGMSDQAPQLQGKRLELLHELLPSATRILLLADTAVTEVSAGLGQRGYFEAARLLHLELTQPEVRTPADVATAFERGARERVEVVLADETPLISGETQRIVELAAAARLPVMSKNRPFVQAGGLISYGPDTDALVRKAAGLVDRILKGAKPADLPIEQAAEFNLAINQKTAATLGLTIPPAILERATDVIR